MPQSHRYVRVQLSSREQREIVRALKDAAKKAVNAAWIVSIAAKINAAEVVEAPPANRTLARSSE